MTLLITDLPLEVIGAIVANVRTLQDLVNLMTASHRFCGAVDTWPGIPHQVLQRQLLAEIPFEVLSYAVSIVAAGDLPRPRSSKDAGKAMASLLYNVAHDPDHTSTLFWRLSFASLLKVRDTHAIIRRLVPAIAQDAWEVLRKEDQVVSGNLVLSEQEKRRIMKAVYETELLSKVFGDESWGTDGMDIFHGADGDLYMSLKASWEIEAIGCVLDFFEKKVFDVSLDVFYHDVEFGAYAFDYLRRGSENEDVIALLSGGVNFFHQLMQKTSYSEKRDLLWKQYEDDNYVALGSLLVEFSQSPLRQPPSQQLASFHRESYPQPGEDLAHKGPQMAFDQTLRGQPPFFHRIYAGQRERGYVFWDANRLMENDCKLLNSLRRPAPATSQIYYSISQGPIYVGTTPAGILAMEDSWEERAAIFDEGGRGYWGQGDYNRIQWVGEKLRDPDDGEYDDTSDEDDEEYE